MDCYLQANINQQYTQLLVMANCFQSEEEYQDSIKAFLERFEENERKEIINFLLVQFPNIRCIQEIQMEILNREGCVKKGIEVAFKAVQVIYTPARSKFEVVREYNKAKLANNSISILQLLDNENFLKYNPNYNFQQKKFLQYMEFPGCIRNIREIIVNLKQDGLKVFDIVERCQEPSLSINRNLLLDILYFVFNCPQINQTDLIRLLKFFGSVTCKFIIQFQYNQLSINSFKLMINIKQLQQLQELQINDKDILNQLIEQLQSV